MPRDFVFDWAELRIRIAALYRVDPNTVNLLEIQFYNPPYEDGTNLGAIKVAYGPDQNWSIQGFYTDMSIRTFMD